MSLDTIPRTAYNEDHEAFRQSVRQFLQKEVAPHAKQWQEDGIVPKSIWPKAGAVGMLCPTAPVEYGGLGLDFGYNAIVDEESAYYGGVATGFSLQSDIVVNYITSYGSEEQKKHWLPKMISGEVITAVPPKAVTAAAISSALSASPRAGVIACKSSSTARSTSTTPATLVVRILTPSAPRWPRSRAISVITPAR